MAHILIADTNAGIADSQNDFSIPLLCAHGNAVAGLGVLKAIVQQDDCELAKLIGVCLNASLKAEIHCHALIFQAGDLTVGLSHTAEQLLKTHCFFL